MTDDDRTRPIRPDDWPNDDPDDESDPLDETRAMDEDTGVVDEPTKAIPTSSEPTRRFEPPTVREPAATQRFQPVGAAAVTETQRIGLPVRQGIAPSLIVGAILLGLLIGALLGYSQNDPSDDNVVARALVGPDGGQRTFDGVGKLEIPRGALPTATSIVVRKEANTRRVRLGAEGDPSAVTYEAGELDVYVFEPADLRFQQPVKVTLPKEGDAEAVLVDTEEGARVIPAEQSETTVSFETTSFAFDNP